MFLINHIALSVKDVTISLEFYQKIFNLKEIENTASKSKTRWLSFSDGKQLHLIYRPNDKIKTTKAVHFAFSTKNFEQFVMSLKAFNISFSEWINSPNKDYIRNDGIKQIYFQDPDGYWLEVNDDATI